MKQNSIFLAIFILIFISCQEKIDKNLVEKALAEKADLHKKEYFEKCYKQILDEASKKVDTMILNNPTLWQTNMDSINRPAKMNKPSRFDWNSNLDTANVKPLFKGKTKE